MLICVSMLNLGTQRGLASILGPMREGGATQDEIDQVTRRARQYYEARRGLQNGNTRENHPGRAEEDQQQADRSV